MQRYTINNLEQLDEVAKHLASTIPHPAWVYLVGDLGTGKTTFTQRFIAHKGYSGRVTSPTYAIMQDYQCYTESNSSDGNSNGNSDGNQSYIIHCDLYRLAEAEELYEIGLIELSEEQSAITLIEWPSKGAGVLPQPDYTLTFHLNNQQRELYVEQS